MVSIIRVYDTEARAITNDGTGEITASTLDSKEVIRNSITATPFFIYNKHYYRIESNEPVTEFHIDWDEGEDNSPEKASIEIIKLDNPAFSAITEHIFTEHKQFNPLIRVKSMEGFLSKWYTNDANDEHNYKALENTNLNFGQNESSVVSEEYGATDLIPIFVPSNLPPIGVLKIDKKRLYHGIDNDLISGTYPLLYAYSTTSKTAGNLPDIIFTYQDSSGTVRKHTMSNSSTKLIFGGGTWTHGLVTGNTSVNAVPTGNYSGTPTKTFYIKKLLRVELSNAKLLDDSDKIFIKVFDAAAAVNTVAVAVSTTSPVARADKTIAILTNGNPIVEVSHDSIAHLDAAESRTRASDVDIASYIFDTDKLIIGGDIQGLSDNEDDPAQATDVLVGTFVNVPSKKVSYTAHMEGHSLDSDNRFQNFFRLCRAQVKDDADMTDEIDNLNTSIIENFSATRQTYAHRHQGADAVLEMNGAILMSNHNHDGLISTEADWEDVTDRNRNTTQEIMGSPNTNSDGTYVIRGGTAGDIPKNWLFISKIEQFDRLFLRMANNNVYDNAVLSQGARMPTVEMTAYYNNGTTWAPLEIIDGTNGLKNSGSIKFTVPSDWHKGTYLNVDSGDWDGPVAETETSSDPATGPKSLWTTTNFPSGAYGFLLGINATITADDNRKLRMMNAWAYNNSHSQLIELVDPNYVSLNSIAIAQSISFGRTSKVMSVEDKFGKSDIRKLGASGGKITFGSIDLGGSVDDRKTMVSYQKNATPVFLDITHKSDEITRFFGVIIQLTEDHPAGMMYPKWAVTMQISHILELSSIGDVNSDKISIGGALVDDGKYLL